MLSFEGKNHSGENRKAVFGSPIIAKAVLRAAGGETVIIVVFQKSTRQEFYWVFRAKSPRSSRRSWRFADHYMRSLSFSSVTPAPYTDFGSLVAHHARLQRLEVVSQRVMHKKRLSGLLVETEHDSIYANWTPQDPATITTSRARQLARRARSRGIVW